MNIFNYTLSDLWGTYKTLSRRVLELNNYSNQSYYFLLEMLNHSSLAMTKKYLGIREKEIHDVYDSVRL
jgi:hypothetical protein